MELGERGGGSELGGVEGQGTVIRMYFVRKECIFDHKRKNAH